MQSVSTPDWPVRPSGSCRRFVGSLLRGMLSSRRGAAGHEGLASHGASGSYPLTLDDLPDIPNTRAASHSSRLSRVAKLG